MDVGPKIQALPTSIWLLTLLFFQFWGRVFNNLGISPEKQQNIPRCLTNWIQLLQWFERNEKQCENYWRKQLSELILCRAILNKRRKSIEFQSNTATVSNVCYNMFNNNNAICCCCLLFQNSKFWIFTAFSSSGTITHII